MITKRSKFWTIVFAFLPGAGHMYNGFMKLGVSFMGLFFAVWAAAFVIDIGAIAFLAPVIWFYAFFDCINRVFVPDDEFYIQEDHYLFTKEQLERWNIKLKERNLIVGIALIVVGAYTLWNNVIIHMLTTYDMIPEFAYNMIYDIGNVLPRLIVGILIIWAGIVLIQGKKKEIEVKDDDGEN